MCCSSRDAIRFGVLVASIIIAVAAQDCEFVRLEASNYPGFFVRHSSFQGFISQVDFSNQLQREDSTWRIIPGLASSACWSFESFNYPGFFLRHQNYRVRIDEAGSSPSTLFRNDATFCGHSPLVASTGATVSLESQNFPEYYIRHRSFQLWIDPFDTSALYAADSSFKLVCVI